MELAWARYSRWRSVAIGFTISTVVGLTLGVLGPFGSYLNGSLSVRIAYWLVCLWVGWLAFGISLPILARWAQTGGISAWLLVPPAVAVLALVPAALSRMLALRMWPVVGEVTPIEWYSQCLAVSAIATIGILWASRQRATPARRPNPLSFDPRDRLPPHLGCSVLCLQVEDHYVRVHTPLGSSLVLMSLSQAMAGLKDVEGIQTHRSWWVARAAITGVFEEGRNVRLRLTGGLEAPVSRLRVGVLREEGWLIDVSAGATGPTAIVR